MGKKIFSRYPIQQAKGLTWKETAVMLTTNLYVKHRKFGHLLDKFLNRNQFQYRVNSWGVHKMKENPKEVLYPSMKPHSHGKLRSRCEAMAAVRHSAKQGRKARRITTKDNFFNALGSRPNPARSKITVSATLLKKRKQHLIKWVQFAYKNAHLSKNYSNNNLA